MAQSRFFIDDQLAVGDAIELPAKVAHHAGHVLRLREGDPVVLFNGRGGEFHGRLGRGQLVALTEHVAVERESPVAVTLVQAWIATEKLEWVVEKAVELGAARIVLVPARRSVVRLDQARLAKRVDRLREIAVAACCQCGRNRVPPMTAFADLADALEHARSGATALVLHPDAKRSLVGAAAAQAGAIAVAVGPEGGYDPDELTLMRRSGYEPVRLGPRVLRTETAGLAALAALQGRFGDLA